jgi:hypothetical protein
MSNVRADIEAMERFLGHLRDFDRSLSDDFRAMFSHLRELGDAWSDAKYHEFRDDLEEVTTGVERYLAAAEGHEAHLQRLIEHLRVFLET